MLAFAAISCDNPQSPESRSPRPLLSADEAAPAEPAQPAEPAGNGGFVTLCKVGSDANFTVTNPPAAAIPRFFPDGACAKVFGGKKATKDPTSNRVVVNELVTNGIRPDSIIVVASVPSHPELDDTTRYRARTQVSVTVDGSTNITITYYNPPPQPTGAWIGLKNSDDVGTRFDFLVEVLKGADVVGATQLDNQASGSSGLGNAILRALSSEFDVTTLAPGEQLGVRLSVRIAEDVAGHRSGTARLWYGDAVANSAVDLTVGGVASRYYLTYGFVLSETTGAGPRSTIDVTVDRAVDGNPFKPFATWTKTF
jgi:hypothetical protein